MGKPIEIKLDAETTGAERGIDNTADALDDLAKGLGDVSDAGTDAGRDLDKSLDGVSDDAKDAARVIDRDLTKALEETAKAGKRAGDDIGDGVKRGYREAEDAATRFGDRAGETTDEFKDEARQNFGEITSSFTGDMDSIADLAQGTFGGLAGTLTGPLGLAFGGLAAAAGVFYNAWKENSEKTQQRISDMYDDMLTSGADFLSKDYIADQLSKIYQGADDAAIKVGELRDLATMSNIPEPLLARALVGDAAAREQIKSEIAAQRLGINEALDDATARGQNMAPALDPAMQALREIEGLVNGTSEGFTQAQQNADAARQAIAGITAPTQGVAQSAEDARAKFDGIGQAIANLPTAITIPVSADTREFRDAIWAIQNTTYRANVIANITGMRVV